MIVNSTSLVLAEPNNPVIGWDNLVTATNVVASSEAVGYPAINVANPITSPLVRWQASSTAAQTLSIAFLASTTVNYFAIARHNLGTAGAAITIEGSTNSGVGWFTIVQATTLTDDAPTIFRFVTQALTNVRASIGVGSEAAEIAVVYTGLLLTLQRRIYVGHTPITFGRSQKVANGKSEGGDFLGRIILSEQTATNVDIQNLTASWYRSTLDPFIQASKDSPFFFAWRPGSYPLEVGFAWMTNDPQPTNQRSNGMMQIQLQMTGIAP
jgi:hypothetical protein